MTLSACATAGRHPDLQPTAPIIGVRYQIKPVCPPELDLALPPAPAVPQGAVIRANPDGENWLDAKDAREQLLAQRLVDAAKFCPKDPVK